MANLIKFSSLDLIHMVIRGLLNVYVENNNTNIYAKFQLHPPYDFWEEDFWIFLKKNNIWQPVKINNLDKIHMVCRGLLQEHFCKLFVKISAMR